MLSKIVQESVSKYNEQYVLFKFAGQLLDEPQIHPSVKPKEMEKLLISSQISLLEAELERKKGMLNNAIQKNGIYEAHRIYSNDYLYLIQEDITYLTEQIELIKKMV